MSGGDRFMIFEQNLLKIWVLLNHKSFGFEKEEQAILDVIQSSFKSDGWNLQHSPVQTDIEKINSTISKFNNKAKMDLLKDVSEGTIRKTDSGGAYELSLNGERLAISTTFKPSEWLESI